MYGGSIVELVLDNPAGSYGHAIGICAADVEAVIAAQCYLVGRHAVVLQTATVKQAQLRCDLPCVGKVECELVFRTLGIFRTQLIEVVGLCA